jgi:hypothetical protein
MAFGLWQQVGQFASVVLRVSGGHVQQYLVISVGRGAERSCNARLYAGEKKTTKDGNGDAANQKQGHDTMNTPDIRDAFSHGQKSPSQTIDSSAA